MKKGIAEAEYNAVFDGSEQLEHTLREISDNVTIDMKTLPVEQLVLSVFKKKSRAKTRIGLTASVQHWGVISPIHVLALEDKDRYLVLDGVRRLAGAMRNRIKEVPCAVWRFEDVNKGKKYANILALMINRSAHFAVTEQWDMLQILEEVNDIQPVLAEYLLCLNPGEAMKLKDIMLCDAAYSEVTEKLLDGSYSIEQAYKKLCSLRKKENALEKEDKTAIANPDEDKSSIRNNDRLSGKEVDERLELGGAQNPHFEIGEPVSEDDTDSDSDNYGKLNDEDVSALLSEADSISEVGGLPEDNEVTAEEIAALDKTDELRGTSVHQKVGQRHPIDPSVRTGTFIRDGFKCRCCGLGGSEAYLSILAFHHAVPVAMGGPDTKENGLTLCVNCHIMLHNYLIGKLQIDFALLSAEERKRFKNIIRFGNLALEAKKKQHISLKELYAAVEEDTKHPMPNKYIAENRKAFEEAKHIPSITGDTADSGEGDIFADIEETE